MIDLVVILKGVVEFAALMLLGQGIVYLLSFGKHEANAVYRMFVLVTSPVVKFARVVTPRQVSDRHVPFVGFMLLFWIWFALVALKVSMGAPVVPSAATP